MDLPKKITFAPQDRLEAVEHLAPRFFTEVVGMEYSDCLVTDESDLRDFATEEGGVEQMLDRFRTHYLLNPPAGTLYIVDFLECLEAHGVSA